MPHRCVLCGTKGATCGQRTRVVAVDQIVRGVRAVGNKLFPEAQIRSFDPDPTDGDVVERYTVSRRRGARNMEGHTVTAVNVAHTHLDYVRCTDGLVRKMTKAEAKAYVDTYGDVEGVEITKSGTAPEPNPNQVIGATKARIGELFDSNGKQMVETQPMTTRTFNVGDRVNTNAVTPPIGSAHANQSDTIMSGSGNDSTKTALDDDEKPKSGAAMRKPNASAGSRE